MSHIQPRAVSAMTQLESESLFILHKIDEILTWEKAKERDRGVRFRGRLCTRH